MSYSILAPDDRFYGPVSASELLQWSAEGRVEASTVVFDHQREVFKKFRDMRLSEEPARAAGGGATDASTPSDPEVMELVKQCRRGFFTELPADAAARLSERLLPRRYSPGQKLFEEGTSGASAFFILSGGANVVIKAAGGEQKLAVLQPGDVIGEMAFFGNQIRSASVVADSHVMAGELTQQTFERICSTEAALAARLNLAFARMFSVRMRQNNNRYQTAINAAKSVR